METNCQSFLSPSKLCYYYDNKCIDWYSSCSAYAPENNFNENICKSISGSDEFHKCDVLPAAQGSNKVCNNVYKECRDLSETECKSAPFLNNLNLGDDKRCLYLNDICNLHYNSCTNPALNSEAKCINNIPSDIKKKCKWEDSCKEVFKECKDLTETECLSSDFNIGLDETKRCVFYNGKCDLHYNSCTNEALNDQDKCKNNIPSDNRKKCKWDSSCKEDDRLCADFIVFKERNSLINLPCYSLSHSNPKICFFDGKDCFETFTDCTQYEGNDKAECEKIKPLDKPSDSSNDGEYYVDKFNKCVFENNDCIEKPRVCDDFKKRKEDETTLTCSDLKSEKDPENNKAKCELDGDKCKDMYLKCEYYSDLVPDKKNRNDNDCKSIIARIEEGGSLVKDDHYKCSVKEDGNNNCVTVKKDCEEITKEETCNRFFPIEGNTDIICIFDGVCKKSFIECETYSNYYKNDPSKITRNGCESINPIYSDGKKYKCEYKEEAGTKTCEKKEITKCEDYKGQDESYCTRLPTNNTSLFICKFINKECVTQYKNCEVYNSQIGVNGLVIDKNTCESIVLGDEKLKCMYEKDKYCETKNKLCSEYLGEDNNKCSLYKTLDTRTSCVIENKKCVEKFIPTTISEEYKYCSDYRGTDKDFCKSIQPYKNDGSSSIPDLSSKCEFENNECVRVSKKCEEGKDENECVEIIPTDKDKKRCVFTNNKCIEQYKTCALYNAIDGTINKDVCESILIENNYRTKKCVFTAGTGGAKNTCTEEDRVCTDFQVEFYRGQCSGIALTDQTKKCVFYNNACSKVDKTCFDMANLAGADDEKCGKGSISSSNKICVAKEDGSGCQEIDKPKEQNTETETKAEESYGGKKYLSKLVFILLCLFV